MDELFEAAARLIARADGLLIGAGAGMGVDSGLPDFRGVEGFWRAYPPLQALGRDFVDMANPLLFEQDPELAWGFYGHRLGLYRDTAPHEGFAQLLAMGSELRQGAFAWTSNVDGHFQKAGLSEERVLECHGSLLHLQCTEPCGDAIWSADGVSLEVDMSSVRATGSLPTCPRCGALARPAILMFGDWAWLDGRKVVQKARFTRWLEGVRHGRLAVIELGAGTAIPTVRMLCERTARRFGAPLIRVNPREPQGPARTIKLPIGAREAVAGIAAALDDLRD